MSLERPPLHALTGIRFLAAIHVVFFHYAPAGLPPYVRNVVQNGQLAVGLFFILSGFVLAYNYAGRTVTPRKFWLARFARIYPAYVLGFLLIAPAVVMFLHRDPLKLVATGLAAGSLLQGWIPPLALLWNGPGWSLSNEAFFYLLFPFILPFLERLSRRGLWLAAAACCVTAAGAGAEGLAFVPLFRLPEFVLGVAAGLMYLRQPLTMGRGVVTGLLLSVTAALTLAAVLMRPGTAVMAPLFALFVFALASDRGITARFLACRPMTALGEASYAIYILQSPLMAYFLVATQGFVAGMSRNRLSWTHFLLFSGVLISVSLVCFVWLEIPARRWILQVRPKKEMVPSDPISSLAPYRHARH